jgi:hypothetical protein
MKITLKKIAIVAVIAMSATLSQAQLGTPSRVVVSGAKEAYAAITNNTSCAFTNAILDVSKGKDATVWFSSALSGAGTTANTVTLQASNDKTTWITWGSFTVTPAGTTRTATYTNTSLGGMQYLRVSSIANANANTGYITNYFVNYTVK